MAGVGAARKTERPGEGADGVVEGKDRKEMAAEEERLEETMEVGFRGEAGDAVEFNTTMPSRGEGGDSIVVCIVGVGKVAASADPVGQSRLAGSMAWIGAASLGVASRHRPNRGSRVCAG